jgi:hypothetical protein
MTGLDLGHTAIYVGQSRISLDLCKDAVERSALTLIAKIRHILCDLSGLLGLISSAAHFDRLFL